MRTTNLQVLLLLLILLGLSGASLAKPLVEKVEPPNWWTGHSINPVRLMIRGKGFNKGNKGTSLRALNPSIKIDNVKINETGRYMFADVSIPEELPSGSYPLEITTSLGKVRVPFTISPIGRHPTAQSENRVTNKDVIYLIMSDRFSNGDTTNDRPRGTSSFANDRRNSKGWHGGDFTGIRNQLPYLKELGVTAIWLTPWYQNPDNVVRCGKPSCAGTSYHGNHAIDYYGIEGRLGSITDLRVLVQEARRNGIKVIQDQVANHVGSNHPWIKNRPLGNWFSDFSQNTFNNSVLLSPNRSQKERDALIRGWFSETLPDLNHAEPEVVKYQIQNALWWIEMSGISGVRQDVVQYMPREFIRDWSKAILKQYPGFWMVGEVFEVDSAQTAFFQGGKIGWDGVDTKIPAVFDVKLWDTSRKVFTGKKPVRALRDTLKYDGLYSDINNVVLLTNNHNTDRFMSLNSATADGAKMHVAFVLSTRGIPQLYYGEEILMIGGNEPDNHRAFPGGWSGDPANKFRANERTFKEQDMYEWTKSWIKARKSRIELQSGRTIDLFYDNDQYVFARTKTVSGTQPTSIVAINRSRFEKTITVDAPVAKIGDSGSSVLSRLAGEGVTATYGSGQIQLKFAPKSMAVFSFNR